MDSPQRQERRDFRYALHLPVLIRMAQRKEMRTRSENISLSGILLSSAFLIPEGAAVEVSVGVDHLPDPGILLSAHGKVLRVRPTDSGDFSVAIMLDGAFSLPRSEPGSFVGPTTLGSTTRDSKTLGSTTSNSATPGSTVLGSSTKKPPSSESRVNRTINRGMHIGLAWHTET